MLRAVLPMESVQATGTDGAILVIGSRLPSLPGQNLPARRETMDEALAIQERVCALSTTQLRNATAKQPTQADLDLARERAEALKLYHDYRRRGCSRELAAARVRSAHQDRFRLLPTAGKHGGNAIDERNLDNWAKAIRTRSGGYDYSQVDQLVPGYAKGTRERWGDPRFWRFFAAHYLKQGGPSLNECHRLAVADCRREFVTEIPSVSAVRRWYATHVDQASIDIARRGKDIFGEKYQYFIQRDWEGVSVNDIWVSDHHDLDCPCCVIGDDGVARAVRLTLTAIIDAKSLYFVGWQINIGAGNNYTIMTSLALASCTAELRTPVHFQCDNGMDYKAKGFSDPVQAGDHLHSVARQLGMGIILSLPYNAQAKIIERVFGMVAGWFAKRWAGYLGNRPGTRSAAADYLWQHPELLPTYDELVTEFTIFLREVYHEHRGSEHDAILHGKCPREIWESRHDLRPAWDPTLLRQAFLMPRGIKTVQQGPCVVLDKQRYYSELLWPYVGKPGTAGQVLYKIDRWDSSHIYLFEFDGRPIGEARLRDKRAAYCLDDEAERAELAKAMQFKSRQLKRSMTAVYDLTDGTYRLADPRERILALTSGDQYRMVKVGGRNSVKGGTHQYEHYVLAEAGSEPALPVQTPSQKVAGLVQPGRMVAGMESAPPPPQARPEVHDALEEYLAREAGIDSGRAETVTTTVDADAVDRWFEQMEDGHDGR